MKAPFFRNPPVRTYQSYAYALGAILPLGENVEGLLYNWFISLTCVSNLKSGRRPIILPPFLSPDVMSANGLGPQLSFVANTPAELAAAIAISINRGFFVRLGVDEYYIPERSSYRIRHRIHDVLVSDVSSDGKNFELIGYCSDRRYRPSRCAIDDLSKGYFGGADQIGRNAFLAYKAELSRPIVIDFCTIKRELLDFIDCRGCPPMGGELAQTDNSSILHGLAVFDACEEYLRRLSGAEWLDRRIFSLLGEHSLLMLRRTLRVEEMLGRMIDKAPSERARNITERLKLLSLLPEHRRSSEVFGEMARLVRGAKLESRQAAEILGMAIDSRI